MWISSKASSSTIQIKNDTITYNNQHGVFLQSGANASFGYCHITNNGWHGLYCLSNTSPNLRGSTGNNWIHHNVCSGVKAAFSSWPKLGLDYQQLPLKDYYGYNHIYDNTLYEVENANGGGTYLMAERNYWSASEIIPVWPDNIYGLVDYDPNLPKIDMDNDLPTFTEAYELELIEEYENALSAYLKIIEQDAKSSDAAFAVGGIVRCFEAMEHHSEILPFLEDMIKKYPATLTDYAARDVSLPYLVNLKYYDSAIERTKVLLQFYEKDAGRELLYSYILADIYEFRSQGKAGADQNEATAYYLALIEKAPDSDYAFWAKMRLKEISGGALTKPFTEESIIEKQTPGDFDLAQNYPNPFNPTTNIRYQLPQSSHVTLTIYNIQGQKIRTLIDNRLQSAGIHVAQWNGLDDIDNSVASGVYISCLTADDFVQSRKMILMK